MLLRSALRALALPVLGAALVACRADPHYAKQPALDLDALPGPAASAFSSEASLAANQPAILSAYGAGTDATFPGTAGVTIHYHFVEKPGADAIVLLPGRTEPVLKYAEVFSDLVAQGYSVYALDHRGQGASGRMTEDPDKGYVEFFHDYVDDLDLFVRTVVTARPHPHLFLLAHSMGGAVAVLYLDEHPTTFTAAALTAPMLEIDTGAFAPTIALTLGASDCNISDGKAFAVGSADYKEEASVAESTVTHSEARWQLKLQMFRDHPEIKLGGVTYRWLCEALAGSSRAQTLGRYSNVPTLLFQDALDSIVKPGGEDHYCGDAARCQIDKVPDSFHEVLMEGDVIRNLALSKTVRYFNYWGSR